MDEDTTFYATMYQGVIRTLNNKYPLLYRTRAGAIRESRRYTGVSVVSVNARKFDLAQCSIDDTWPTGISTSRAPASSGSTLGQGDENHEAHSPDHS